MYQGNFSKKISFRCTTSTFNTLYSSYLKYKAYNKSGTFSDYIRNLCLGAVLSSDEDKTIHQHD